MSDEEYEPGPTERKVISTLDQIIEDILTGKIAGLGVCGQKKNGEQIYFFMDGAPPQVGLLHPSLNKLVGIYTQRQKFAGNAPSNNISYGIH